MEATKGAFFPVYFRTCGKDFRHLHLVVNFTPEGISFSSAGDLCDCRPEDIPCPPGSLVIARFFDGKTRWIQCEKTRIRSTKLGNIISDFSHVVWVACLRLRLKPAGTLVLFPSDQDEETIYSDVLFAITTVT